MKRKILVSVTTLTPGLWEKKIKEIDRLKIKEIALFLTVTNYRERQLIYRQLEKTSLKQIPFVHLRSDMKTSEIEYLITRFKTKAFNVHPTAEGINFIKKNKKYSKIIFIENILLDEYFLQGLKKAGGICLDVSHWEDYGFKQKLSSFRDFKKYLNKYKIGCCHISGMKNKAFYFYIEETGKKVKNYSSHKLADIKELDYIKKYKKYLRGYIAIELENSLVEQLEIKKYLEKIIN